MFQLNGKRALITGASGDGLGRAHALALGSLGCEIVLLDIVNCQETVKILKENQIQACYFECDIADHEAVQKTINSIFDSVGQIDILVNNASILTTVGMFPDISIEKWNRDIQVNLIGSANVTRCVWPKLLQQKWGRVIFMSSIAGTLGGAGQTSYATSKSGVIGLAKSLALEGAKSNITVNCIAPGVIGSKAVHGFIREDMLKRMEKKAAMRRLGDMKEIAQTLCFLASEESSFLTGQVITVDGGASLFTF